MNIYAHRGASGTFPENTVAAFKEAARLPIFGVEFDVHMTVDGEIVVIHDETIDRTSDGSGFVKDMTLEELKSYDFGLWFGEEFAGQRIPTLREVLEIFVGTQHHINIELKSDVFPYEGMDRKVVELVKELQLVNRVVISSFDHESVQRVKEMELNLEAAALFAEVLTDFYHYGKSIPADALHLSLPAVLRKSGRSAVEQGARVRVYTVNEEKYANQLKEIGVEAIFTDYPEKMLEVL